MEQIESLTHICYCKTQNLFTSKPIKILECPIFRSIVKLSGIKCLRDIGRDLYSTITTKRIVLAIKSAQVDMILVNSKIEATSLDMRNGNFCRPFGRLFLCRCMFPLPKERVFTNPNKEYK